MKRVDKDSIVPPAYLFGRLFFPGLVADAAAMERLFEESELDWTIVRPPRLTDKPYTGKYRVREAICPVSASRSRARMWPISCSRQSKTCLKPQDRRGVQLTLPRIRREMSSSILKEDH